MEYNTMRFGTDTFTLSTKKALFICTKPIPDSLNYDEILSFTVDAYQPAQSDIRFFIADKDGKCYAYRTSGGHFSSIFNAGSGNYYWYVNGPNPVDVDAVLTYGNTVDELRQAKESSISTTSSTFPKPHYLIVAMQAEGSLLPTFKVVANLRRTDTITVKDRIYTGTFASPVKIVDYDFNPSKRSNDHSDTNYSVTIAYKTTASGDYSAYGDLDSVLDKDIYGYKLHVYQSVHSTESTDYINLGKLTFYINEDTTCPVFGDYADLYSIVKNFYLPLKYCSVIVKHSLLTTDSIKAYVNVAPGRFSTVYKALGTSSGSAQTFNLDTAKFIDPSTIKVFINGVATNYFAFNASDNTITLAKYDGSAACSAGAAITASYSYNLQTENWVELPADKSQHDISDGHYLTRFSSKITNSNALVSAIRIRLFRGQQTNKSYTYTATGSEQSYKYSTAIDYARILGDVDFEWDFDYDSHTITFTAPKGTAVTVETIECGDVPKIFSYTAGYSL